MLGGPFAVAVVVPAKVPMLSVVPALIFVVVDDALAAAAVVAVVAAVVAAVA